MMLRILLAVAVVLHAGMMFAQEWQMALPQRATYSIAVNPKNSASIIAGNMARTMFSSLDGGQTWQEVFVGDAGGVSLLTTVMFHPVDTTIIFAGGLGFTGLDRSTNSGESWQNVLADPVGRRFEVASSSAIAVNPSNADMMYVLRSNPAIVYQSNDRGETWDSLSAIPGLGATDKMLALAVDPKNPSVMLATGARTMMFRSTDAGRSWTVVDTLRTWPDAEGAHIRFSPTQPNRVYTAARFNQGPLTMNGGVHVSNDNGISWEPMKFVDTAINALEVYPTKSGDEMFIGGASTLVSVPGMKGDSIVMRSADGGTTWQDLSNVAWTPNELDVLAANVWGFARTELDGRPEILMATECGVYRSTAVTSVKEQPNTASVIRLELRGDMLRIVLPDGVTQGVVVISDMLGRAIAQIPCHAATEHNIGFPATSSGTYVASVVAGQHRAAIVVQR
jgi:photosystem II stability/assembly factor-like uncharacterized protein